MIPQIDKPITQIGSRQENLRNRLKICEIPRPSLFLQNFS